MRQLLFALGTMMTRIEAVGVKKLLGETIFLDAMGAVTENFMFELSPALLHEFLGMTREICTVTDLTSVQIDKVLLIFKGLQEAPLSMA